jgi:hypothetical protein
MDFERIARVAREESDKARGVKPQTESLAAAVGKLTTYTFVLGDVAEAARELLAALEGCRDAMDRAMEAHGTERVVHPAHLSEWAAAVSAADHAITKTTR